MALKKAAYVPRDEKFDPDLMPQNIPKSFENLNLREKFIQKTFCVSDYQVSSATNKTFYTCPANKIFILDDVFATCHLELTPEQISSVKLCVNNSTYVIATWGYRTFFDAGDYFGGIGGNFSATNMNILISSGQSLIVYWSSPICGPIRNYNTIILKGREYDLNEFLKLKNYETIDLSFSSV